MALLDTAFWPLLKRCFYLAEDVISGRDRLGLPEGGWNALRYLLLGLSGLLVLWAALSAAKHHQDVQLILAEFLSTWPAARVTETFKLCSFWALLHEYGLPEPKEPKSPAERPEPRTPDDDKPLEQPAAPSVGVATHRLGDEVDEKRTPLLAAQH